MLHDLDHAPTVSVLLPAWNEEEMLGRCLDSLLSIARPNLEIVLCAGGTDGTLAVAKRYAGAHPDRIALLEQRPGEGKQVALRRCLERSRGQILYFTDADCVVPAPALEQVVAKVASGEADAATGPADPLPEQRDDPWVRHQWATIRAVDRQRGPDATGLLGRNFAAHRAAVEAAGGFREPVPIGTDYHLAKVLLQQGRAIRYVPEPVQTSYLEEVGPYLRQQSRWLRNIFVHGRQFGDRAEIVACTRTVALGTGLLLWPISWPWSRRPGVALWLLAIGWMAKERVRQQRALEVEMALRPLGQRRATFNAVAFSLIDLLVWSRPVLDILLPGRRLRW